MSGGQVIGSLIAAAIILAGMWKIFTKAKQPGWAVIIPIYNTYILLKIIGRPWWWLLLLLIPIVNIVLGIMMYHELAKSFGKGVGYTLLLLLLPFIGFPVLGFGSAQYQGPAAGRA
ncbi:MAG TPA: DUF5684 domain-containing protein [Candidatus Saccharimonadia bacterium]|nr:DUF5684 domain-containing protein [Candidatus Saccharimonadia bacterium]